MIEADGFELVNDVVSSEERQRLLGLLGQQAQSRSLLDEPWCADLARRLRASPLARLLPDSAVAVQCTYFDKSARSNWFVGYHQDLTIPVRGRVASAACAGWTRKEGATFVQPPLPVLQSLLAVRVHLDENTAGNGPLRVIPGSHAHGRIAAAAIPGLRHNRGEVVCLAPQRSALAFRPLLLHASSKSRDGLPRRVLHFLFGPAALPHGLQWRTAV